MTSPISFAPSDLVDEPSVSLFPDDFVDDTHMGCQTHMGTLLDISGAGVPPGSPQLRRAFATICIEQDLLDKFRNREPVFHEAPTIVPQPPREGMHL